MKEVKESDRQALDGLLNMMTAEELETVRKITAAMIRQNGKKKRSGA